MFTYIFNKKNLSSVSYREASEDDTDYKARYKNGMYSKLKSFDSPRKHAVRVELAVPNIFSHEKKFFCDKPSDKFATLRVSKIHTQ